MAAFSSPILQTKLNRPQVIDHLVERPRLVEKLNRGLDRKLTLVAASAGYGKTTLVCQWLDNCDRSAAWLALDENDNDLTLFLNYLIAAIRTLYPQACHETGALARAERLPPVEYIATTLINDIAALPEPFILVLDDYHVITERMIHELTDRLLRYLPTQMHLVLCSRTDPPMALSLLRGRQQINELRVNDLRFSLEEAEKFLEQAMGEPVPGEITDMVERRTEGWITGLRLATLSMRDSQDYQTFLADFGGDSTSMLVDYLMEEVLSRQSPSHQQFLIRTAIFDRFCAPLCDAILAADDDAGSAVVSGGGEQGGRIGDSSQEVILSLERSGLFVIPLDDQRQWYRYHDLFRDMLRQRFHDRLSPEEQAEVYRRASAWYAAHGHIEQALQYALAGDDVAGAVHLVEQHRISVMNQADWRTLERWLEMLPEAVVQSRPSLLLTQALVYNTTKVNWPSIPVLKKAEHLLEHDESLPEAERTVLQAEINTLLASRLYYLGEYEQVLALTSHMLQHLSPAHSYLRGPALGFGCLVQQSMGRTDAAIQQLTDTAFDPNESYPLRVHVLYALCLVYLTIGDLQQTRQIARHLHRLGEYHDFLRARTWADYLSGVVHYEWNELENAAAFYEQVFHFRYSTMPFVVNMALVGLTKTHLAADRPDQARETIDKLHAYILETGSINLPPEIDLLRSSVLFQRGQVQPAERWGQPVQSSPLPTPLSFYENRDLMQLTVRLVQEQEGDWQAVTEQLQAMLQKAIQGHGAMRCIQVRAHLALVYSKQGRLEDALGELRQALSLGQAGGFIRTFVDLGAGMAELLRQFVALASADEGVTDYAVQILNAFPAPPVTSDPAQTVWRQSRVAMIEPLTRRESEVLVLLAQNLSYREITVQLVVTLNTVKKHASHVYGKLGVNNRADAIEKAVLLQVLPPA